MSDQQFALEAEGLGKRYGRRWALQGCSFSVPAGRIVALVGPNGAGKSTLLRIAAGLSRPTTGEITVLGSSPRAEQRELLQRVSYLDQERPLYKSFKVAEMLRVGRELNVSWDDAGARRHLDELSISLADRVGNLSVGQQAQVALTLCVAKQPDLLLLDEPVAALDPLARAQAMQILLASAAESGRTVVMSSHVIADLENVCDFVLLLSGAEVRLAAELDSILAEHRVLVGPRSPLGAAPASTTVVHAATTDRQSTWLVRGTAAVEWYSVSAELGSGWDVLEPTLEEIVLAYLRDQALAGRTPRDGAVHHPTEEVAVQ